MQDNESEYEVSAGKALCQNAWDRVGAMVKVHYIVVVFPVHLFLYNALHGPHNKTAFIHHLLMPRTLCTSSHLILKIAL